MTCASNYIPYMMLDVITSPLPNLNQTMFVKWTPEHESIHSKPPWWRHQVETSSPFQRSVTRSFDVFLDLRPDKRFSKQPWGWWFETPSWSLWRQCNDIKFQLPKSDHKSCPMSLTINQWICVHVRNKLCIQSHLIDYIRITATNCGWLFC